MYAKGWYWEQPFPFLASLSPPVRISPQERTRHVYVVGRTGMGKSSLLISILAQDIAAGRGCAVIDPHSDLCSDLLALLHNQGRLNRVSHRLIYINPSSPDYAIPFNVLSVPGKPSDIADNVIEAFKRTWADSLSTAPHFTDLLKHTLLTLIATKRTLVDIPRFLTDFEFREGLLAEAGDPHLTIYFHDRFDRWRDPRMLEGTLNKVTALTLGRRIRTMLGQRQDGIDWRAPDGQRLSFSWTSDTAPRKRSDCSEA
ncbi:MAG: DUF87 domain-containing protein [Chloroflexi bacterium]|nr:DUF87 domain-containing protein [Chloroflexota bacterium]